METPTDTVHVALPRGFAPDEGTVYFWAPAPARGRASFSGSFMPFASLQQAREMNPNEGKVILKKPYPEALDIPVMRPNSWYASPDALEPEKPAMSLFWSEEGVPRQARVDIGFLEIPYRSMKPSATRWCPNEFERYQTGKLLPQDVWFQMRPFPSKTKNSRF